MIRPTTTRQRNQQLTQTPQSRIPPAQHQTRTTQVHTLNRLNYIVLLLYGMADSSVCASSEDDTEEQEETEEQDEEKMKTSDEVQAHALYMFLAPNPV